MSDLSPCQVKALHQLENTSDNIFLTGRAGSGKSFLVRRFLRDKSRKDFPILASTGAAAVLVGGRTFHSFFALGIFEGGAEKTLERALKDRRLAKRLKSISGFVLDEVSMLSGEVLDVTEKICRRVLKNEAPWGGLRVVAVGDFAQLPPISRGDQKDWAFLSDVWKFSQFQSLVLKTMLRSKDEDYLQILNQVRTGVIDENVTSFFAQCEEKFQTQSEDFEQDRVEGTYLLARRSQVATRNRYCLSQIKSPKIQVATVYSGNDRAVEQLKKSAPVPETLELKQGALVMTRINDPQYRFINGSVGEVEEVSEDEVVVRFPKKNPIAIEKHSFSLLSAEGEPIATATNFPLNLAYALTIHKAQGTTLDNIVTELRGLWEPGQAYVALSRLRNGAGLSLAGWDAGSIRVDPQVVAFHQALEGSAEDSALMSVSA